MCKLSKIALVVLSIGSFVLWTPAYSQVPIQYSAMQALVEAVIQPGNNTTDHRGCHNLTATTSPINNKNLNALCELCIGQQDYGVDSIYIAASTTTPIEVLSVCFGTTGSLTDQFQSDYESICSSRGGRTGIAIGGPGAICDMFIP